MPLTKERPRQPANHAQPEQRERRRVSRLRVSATSSIATAAVIKDGGVFFLCKPDGQIPLGGNHGFGLYYHDCRFLNGYELRIPASELDLLASSAAAGFAASLELTNTDIESEEHVVEKEQVGLRWDRTVDGTELLLQDEITFTNYGVETISFPLSVEFGSAFESIFTVRGMAAERRGALHAPAWGQGCLRFLYDGADGVHRSVTISCSPSPQKVAGTRADFHIDIDPGGEVKLAVTVALVESRNVDEVHKRWRAPLDARRAHASKQAASDRAIDSQATVKTDSRALAAVLDRALRDLHMLENHDQGQLYYSAGIPWYVALFGRDSLTASCQTLGFKPEVAADTLRLLSKYQGTRDDAWRDENPGKIMHELRVGEMAHLGEIPQTPYYGTVDATPLFLVVLARHAAWTGSLDLFHELRPHVERALEWIARDGDRNGDGFVEYSGGSSKGLSNQGWKDSSDSIMNADGSLAAPPISLVEVQGYVYMAKRGIADLYRRGGDEERAACLDREAADLRRRFNQAFWLDDLGFYALALQKDGRPCRVVASNPGQALWSGIVDEGRAGAIVKRLFAEEMYSGWGIRTLASGTKRYNPIGYHLGTVWPHDNSIVAAGLRRYGFAGHACRVFQGIVEAAMQFPHYRLPEVFAGFSRQQFAIPVRYPVACHPQAWAAGSIPFLIETLLGLEPHGFERRLRVVEPVLPDFVHYLELHGLRVGKGRVDLRFDREKDGAVAVEVLRKEGEVEVDVKRNSRQ